MLDIKICVSVLFGNLTYAKEWLTRVLFVGYDNDMLITFY